MTRHNKALELLDSDPFRYLSDTTVLAKTSFSLLIIDEQENADWQNISEVLSKYFGCKTVITNDLEIIRSLQSSEYGIDLIILPIKENEPDTSLLYSDALNENTWCITVTNGKSGWFCANPNIKVIANVTNNETGENLKLIRTVLQSVIARRIFNCSEEMVNARSTESLEIKRRVQVVALGYDQRGTANQKHRPERSIIGDSNKHLRPYSEVSSHSPIDIGNLLGQLFKARRKIFGEMSKEKYLSILLFVAHEVAANKVCDITSVSTHTDLSLSTVSRRIEYMVDKKWLIRCSDPHDRRRTNLALPPELNHKIAEYLATVYKIINHQQRIDETPK